MSVITSRRIVCGTMIASACSYYYNNALFKTDACMAVLFGFAIGYVLPILYQSRPPINSQMDRMTSVSRDKWDVTLIRHEGPLGQHAQIVVEGIDWIGSYFMNRAELSGKSCCKGMAKVTNTVVDHCDYSERSEVWQRPRYKVQKMLDAINGEVGQERKLSFLGRHSLFASKDSCITWSIEKLKIADIYLKPNRLSKIVTLSSFFTHSKKELEKKHL